MILPPDLSTRQFCLQVTSSLECLPACSQLRWSVFVNYCPASGCSWLLLEAMEQGILWQIWAKLGLWWLSPKLKAKWVYHVHAHCPSCVLSAERNPQYSTASGLFLHVLWKHRWAHPACQPWMWENDSITMCRHDFSPWIQRAVVVLAVTFPTVAAILSSWLLWTGRWWRTPFLCLSASTARSRLIDRANIASPSANFYVFKNVSLAFWRTISTKQLPVSNKKQFHSSNDVLGSVEAQPVWIWPVKSWWQL